MCAGSARSPRSAVSAFSPAGPGWLSRLRCRGACARRLYIDILPLPMSHFLEDQKPLVTIFVFIATYFGALTIGRLLKRRAGVRLGVLFQLFCLTLAFYAATTFYGVKADWRNHVGAAVFLLSVAFFVALLDRYLWDAYWEKKR